MPGSFALMSWILALIPTPEELLVPLLRYLCHRWSCTDGTTDGLIWVSDEQEGGDT
ncbi:hypothetical protein CsSME_00012290 [Camellia sinensis var. sinensis]